MVNEIEIVFDGSDYYAGSLVRGRIEVRDPKNYTNVNASVVGKAQVNWMEKLDGCRRRLQLSRNTTKYVEAKRVMWSKGAGMLLVCVGWQEPTVCTLLAMHVRARAYILKWVTKPFDVAPF